MKRPHVPVFLAGGLLLTMGCTSDPDPTTSPSPTGTAEPTEAQSTLTPTATEAQTPSASQSPDPSPSETENTPSPSPVDTPTTTESTDAPTPTGTTGITATPDAPTPTAEPGTPGADTPTPEPGTPGADTPTPEPGTPGVETPTAEPGTPGVETPTPDTTEVDTPVATDAPTSTPGETPTAGEETSNPPTPEPDTPTAVESTPTEADATVDPDTPTTAPTPTQEVDTPTATATAEPDTPTPVIDTPTATLAPTPTDAPTPTAEPPTPTAAPTPTAEPPTPTPPPSATPIPPLDLNGDDYPDLVILGTHAQEVNLSQTHLFFGGYQGFGDDPNLSLDSHGAKASCSADFNQDGRRDLVLPGDGSPTGLRSPTYVYWGLPSQAAPFANGQRMVLNHQSITGCAVRDVDNDGFPDLILANGQSAAESEKRSILYFGDNAAPFERSQPLESVPARGVEVAPLHGTPEADLLLPSNEDGGFSLIVTGTPNGFSSGPGILLDTGRTIGQSHILDIDGDGALDVALGATPSGADEEGLMVYWGPGPSDANATFFPMADFADSTMGDLNDDGHLDLILGSRGENAEILIVWGDDDDSYALSSNLPVGSVSSLDVGHLNDDGIVDLIIASDDFDQDIFGYLGSADGPTLDADFNFDGEHVAQIQLQDLDGDDFDDVVVANGPTLEGPTSDSYVYWNGPRQFDESPTNAYATQGTLNIAQGDLNKDGHPELIYANFYDGDTWELQSPIYWGGPAGPDPQNATLLPTLGARQACIGDLNGDGWPDIVFANSRNSLTNRVNSFIYWGGLDGFDPGVRLELPTLDANACLLSDLDGDSDLDLVFANNFDDDSSRVDSFVYWNDAGDFSVANRAELPTIGASAVTAGDLNGDGWPDLVFSNFFDDVTQSLDNDAYIYWGSELGFAPNNREILNAHGGKAAAVIADIDGDDHQDLLLPGYFDGDENVNTYIYWGEEGGLAVENATALPANRVSEALVVDLDGNGLLDVVLATDRDGSLSPESYIYFGDGLRFVGGLKAELDTARTSGVEAADFNGDGLLDLAFATYFASSDETKSPIYFNDDDRFDSPEIIEVDTLGPSNVIAAPMDADARVDLIFANRFNDGEYNVDSVIYWNGKTGLLNGNRQDLIGNGPAAIDIYSK